MSDQKHTAEPWKYELGDLEDDDQDSYVPNIYSKDPPHESIFRADINGDYLQLDEANAKRIVQCVNAMAGIEDPQAFMYNIKKLLERTMQFDCRDDTSY